MQCNRPPWVFQPALCTPQKPLPNRSKTLFGIFTRVFSVRDCREGLCYSSTLKNIPPKVLTTLPHGLSFIFLKKNVCMFLSAFSSTPIVGLGTTRSVARALYFCVCWELKMGIKWVEYTATLKLLWCVGTNHYKADVDVITTAVSQKKKDITWCLICCICFSEVLGL